MKYSLLTLISNNECYFIEQIWIEYFTSITASARAASERHEGLVFSNVAYSSVNSWTLVYGPQDRIPFFFFHRNFYVSVWKSGSGIYNNNKG